MGYISIGSDYEIIAYSFYLLFFGEISKNSMRIPKTRLIVFIFTFFDY